MANEALRHFQVIATNPSKVENTSPTPVALWTPAGTQARLVTQAAAQADTTAVDLAALKVDFNALLAKLRTAGVIASS